MAQSRQHREQLDAQRDARADARKEAARKAQSDAEWRQQQHSLNQAKLDHQKQKLYSDTIGDPSVIADRDSGDEGRQARYRERVEAAGGSFERVEKPGIGPELPPESDAASSAVPTLNDTEYEWAVNALAEDEEARREGREANFSPEERGKLQAAVERTDDEAAALRSDAEIRQEETGEDFETHYDKKGKIGSGGLGLQDQGVSFEPGEPFEPPPPQPSEAVPPQVEWQQTGPGGSTSSFIEGQAWDENRERLKAELFTMAEGAANNPEVQTLIENLTGPAYDSIMKVAGNTPDDVRKFITDQYNKEMGRKVAGQVVGKGFDMVTYGKGEQTARRDIKGEGKDGMSNPSNSYESWRKFKDFENDISGWLADPESFNAATFTALIFRYGKTVAPGDRMTDTDFDRFFGTQTWAAGLRNFIKTGVGIESANELKGVLGEDVTAKISRSTLLNLHKSMHNSRMRSQVRHQENLRRVRGDYESFRANTPEAAQAGYAHEVNRIIRSTEGGELVSSPTPNDIMPNPRGGEGLEQAKVRAELRLTNLIGTNTVSGAQRYLQKHGATMPEATKRMVLEAITDLGKTSQLEGLQSQGADVAESDAITDAYLEGLP